MPETQLTYLLISQGFVVYVDLFVVAALWLIYRNDRKQYLALAIAAGILETGRQIPDFLLAFYPVSTLLYQLSLLLQFAATCLFLASLLHLAVLPVRTRRLLLAVPIILFCLRGILFQLTGVPEEQALDWYVHMLPLYLATFVLIWVAAHVSTGWTPSRFLLTGTGLTLLVLRIWMTGMELGDVFYLVIYMEYLVFPVMLVALILLEAELTNQHVKVLLEQRTQASEDLQFIVDNSDDIILIANEVGLVQTWSRQAENKFGYTALQAIDKLHMDELFAQFKTGTSQSGIAEFQTKMEAKDGHWFKANVSTKTVAHRGHVYTIYVLKDVVEAT